jgi:dolichyl-phosphate beta-glucosyltransferase
MGPELSVILPAFNESQRLPPYLHHIRGYLAGCFNERYELIVVDDGSQDGMPAVLNELRRGWSQLMVLRHERNRGKGAALRTGMLAARGKLLLVADADGATPIDEERKLRTVLEGGADIAFGSRWAPRTGVDSQRSWHRQWVGRAFALLVRGLLHLPVHDSQCGFKMFRRRVGRRLFHLCREPGYLIDVELMVWAHELGYRVVELPIRWTEMPGTKVRLFRDGWHMLRGLPRIRRLSERVREQKTSEAQLAALVQ